MTDAISQIAMSADQSLIYLANNAQNNQYTGEVAAISTGGSYAWGPWLGEGSYTIHVGPNTGNVYVTYDDATNSLCSVFAYSLAGNVIWNFSDAASDSCLDIMGITTDESFVYVLTGAYLFQVNAINGKQIWNFSLPGVPSSMTIYRYSVYIAFASAPFIVVSSAGSISYNSTMVATTSFVLYSLMGSYYFIYGSLPPPRTLWTTVQIMNAETFAPALWETVVLYGQKQTISFLSVTSDGYALAVSNTFGLIMAINLDTGRLQWNTTTTFAPSQPLLVNSSGFITGVGLDRSNNYYLTLFSFQVV